MAQPIARDGSVRTAGLQSVAAFANALASMWWRGRKAISFAIFIGLALGVFVLGWFRPAYNWDLLAYVGAAERSSYETTAALHQHVFGTIQGIAPPEVFTTLTSGDEYRLRQFTDPDAFVSMLGMYESKWLYVELLSVLMTWLGPIGATLAINMLGVVILAVSIAWWLKDKKLDLAAPVAFSMLFLLQFQSFALTQQPDLLANGLMVAALLALERNKLVPASALMILGILVRPDQIAVAGVTFFALWLLADRACKIMLSTFVIAFIAWQITGRFVSSPGWWAHFWFSTYDMQDSMAGFQPAFSLKVYVTAIAYNLYRALFENTWLAAYLLLLTFYVLIYVSRFRGMVRANAIALAILLAVPAKFAIFPLHDGRIYFAPLLVGYLLALSDLWKILVSTELWGPMKLKQAHG